jgi:hypothetical protein
MHNRSDGMVRPEEAKWGDYLITFEHDHLEMVGFNADHIPSNVYNLVIDNIKLNDFMTKMRLSALVLTTYLMERLNNPMHDDKMQL